MADGLTTKPSCGGTDGTIDSIFEPARREAAGAGSTPHTTTRSSTSYRTRAAASSAPRSATGSCSTREPTVDLLAHELGHSFGLGHATGASCIDYLRCSLEDTGDTLSPMGTGSLDYSAYEKSLLGWIPAQPHVTAPKTYVLAPPTTRAKLAQALVVDTSGGTWWIEYRAKPFRGLVFRYVDADVHSAAVR